MNTKQRKKSVLTFFVTLYKALQQSPWDDDIHASLQKSPSVCPSFPVFSDFQKWTFVTGFGRFKQEAYTGI